MSNACKRIPVTKETWEQLGEMKKAGQTYDELIQKLVQEVNRKELAGKFKKAKEGKMKGIALDDI